MTAKRKEQILIVDDAPNTVEIVQRNLEADGYRVFTANDVSTAIHLLEQAASIWSSPISRCRSRAEWNW